MALKLAKAGYGTAQQILEQPLDLVISTIDYERFTQEYEEKFYEINQPEK